MQYVQSLLKKFWTEHIFTVILLCHVYDEMYVRDVDFSQHLSISAREDDGSDVIQPD